MAIKKDHYLELTRTITTGKNKSRQLAATSLDNRILPIDNLTYVLADNGPQFVPKIICNGMIFLWGYKADAHLLYLEINGGFQLYNCKLTARLSYHVSTHQNDRHAYVQPLTYAYKAKWKEQQESLPFR